MKNITVFVPAKFKPISKKKDVEVGTGIHKMGEELTEIHNKWIQIGWSGREIDGFQLQKDVQKALYELNTDNFEVVSVSPVTSGSYKGNRDGYSGYGCGYSYTEGMIIIARKAYDKGFACDKEEDQPSEQSTYSPGM
jgi:hypothetical protein